MDSPDSKIYPGIARQPNTFGTPDPSDPAKLVVTTSHPAPYRRQLDVYIPKQYIAGSVAPFIVGTDGPDQRLFTVLDALIAQHKVPVMIAISLANGGGDAQGSQRGLEYDTMSGKFAEFVETEVFPLVEKNANVVITKDHSVTPPYLATLKREIDHVSRFVSRDRRVVQFHWGGGTPTYLTPAQMEDLFGHAAQNFVFAPDTRMRLKLTVPASARCMQGE